MKKFQIVLSDCPWSYKDKRKSDKRICGGAEVYYPTMNIEDIKNLNVNNITDDNCILFLWATFPNLPLAFDVIKSWGFTYKTIGFNWIKLNKKNDKPFFGIGHYTRSNSEVCLVAVKGKPKIVDHSISSIHMSPVERHSKKPDAIRDKIVKLCGDIPRVELFAREKTEGWTSLGYDIDALDIKEAIDNISKKRKKVFKIVK